MKPKTKRSAIVALIVAVVLIAAVVLASAITRPRSGTPEATADAFLREIRIGRFEAAFAPLRPDGVNDEEEMREKKYRPLWWWCVRDRRGASGEWRLHYTVIRGWIPIPSPVWVTVKKQGDRWRVTRFEAWY